MQLPLQISFHGLDHSEALGANVRKHATKLGDVFAGLDIGSVVTFVEEHGEKGPEASTVRMAGHDRRSRGKTRPSAPSPASAENSTAVPAVASVEPVSLEARPLVASSHPTEEAIRVRAYEHWESAGRPEGDGIQFRLDAEREPIQRI